MTQIYRLESSLFHETYFYCLYQSKDHLHFHGEVWKGKQKVYSVTQENLIYGEDFVIEFLSKMARSRTHPSMFTQLLEDYEGKGEEGR